MGQGPDPSLTVAKRFTNWASPPKVREMIASLYCNLVSPQARVWQRFSKNYFNLRKWMLETETLT